MKYILFLLALLCRAGILRAQKVYTITADSVKLTNCDSTELILENHTQGVKGFLYNTGNGRTTFKKGLQKINDSLYLIGADSLKYNAWVHGGNRWATVGVLGTLDNNHLDLYTNNTQRSRLTNTGNFLLGTTTDNGSKFQVNGNISITSTDQPAIITAAWNSANGNKITIGSNTANNPTIVMGLSSITTHPNNGHFTLTTPASFGNILTLNSGPTNGAIVCSSLQGANAGTILQLTSNAVYSSGGFFPTSGVLTGVRIIGNTSNYLDFNPSSGNATYNMLQVDGAINTSGTYSGIVRGILYSPLPKSLTGVDHRAIETTYGNVMFGTTSGNVLIGTTTNNGVHRLQVNGGMLTTKNVMINGLTVGRGGDANSGNVSLDNTAIGANALVNNQSGTGNTQGGYLSGLHVITGSENTGWGRFTLYVNQSGLRNTALGSAAGYNSIGDGNVFLGAAAGEYETGNHKLYIADTPTTSLMYGDFSTGQLQINQTLNQGFLSTAKFIVNGDTYLHDSIRLNKVITGTSADSVLVINSATHAIHKVAQSSLVINGVLHSSLAVNGEISAKKLRLVQTDWPDYVFDTSYRLPDLKEVQQYIQRYRHLPGIASAAEAAREGIDVGEDQAALLKKIEELTLYAVGQNEANMKLEKKLEVQAAEMEVLKKEMAEFRKILIHKRDK